MHSGAHLVAPHRTPLLDMSLTCCSTVYGPHIDTCIAAMLSEYRTIETIGQHAHCTVLPWGDNCSDIDALPDCSCGVKMVFSDILKDTGRAVAQSVGLCEVPLQRQLENMGMSVSLPPLSSPAWQASVMRMASHPLSGRADALTPLRGWQRAMLTWISSQRGPAQREQEGRRQTSTIMCQTISFGWPSGQDLSETRWRPVQLPQSTLCRPFSAACLRTASSGERHCKDVCG